MPDADYPNILNVSEGSGLISSYVCLPGGSFMLALRDWTVHLMTILIRSRTRYYSDGMGGNMFPSVFPIRCQACGKNVILPNGTRGYFPCAPEDEQWFDPGNSTANATLLAEHKAGLANYTKNHPGSVPYWWVKGLGVNSKCPRRIDCPDWRYEGEQP